jgi:hypothetical protein
VHGAFTESAHAQATASLFTTLRREERLQSQPVRLQDARTFPIPTGIKAKAKAKTRDVVAAKEMAPLNHREENRFRSIGKTTLQRLFKDRQMFQEH